LRGGAAGVGNEEPGALSPPGPSLSSTRAPASHSDPVTAIRRLAEVTFDHHEANPDFVRLVRIENIHHAEHIAELASLVRVNTPAILLLGEILERGRAQGAFRHDIDAIDVHMMISAFCVFRVANRHTFGAIFGRDPLDPARREHYRRLLGNMIVDHLTAVPISPVRG
jgi:hypothetical protein